jgi:hypothetical protein
MMAMDRTIVHQVISKVRETLAEPDTAFLRLGVANSYRRSRTRNERDAGVSPHQHRNVISSLHRAEPTKRFVAL